MDEIETPDAPAAETPAGPLTGDALIREMLPRLPPGPGVYRMLDGRGEALYVGKARSIAKRVVAYTAVTKLSERLRRMVAETAQLEVVSTHTEVEALLLESNLIKRLMPRYNVLLRDDKSFPYIQVSEADTAAPVTSAKRWARITKFRGAREKGGIYFGPFASAGAVNRTLTSLQRAFLLRSCTDGVFTSRTRPCLLHQIKRCSAPCVGRVSPEAYQDLLAEAAGFLSGKDAGIQKRFAQAMEEASRALEFETAASYRDRIRALAHIQSKQDINIGDMDEADVIALHRDAGQTCIQVFFFRGGQNWGNRAYFPRHDKQIETGEILAAFIGQFYDNKTPPRLVLLSEDVPDAALIAEALAVRAGRKVELLVPQRGDKRKLVENAHDNAKSALARRLAESASQRRLLEAVADAFKLEGVPERVEIYDNSHIQGTNAVGAMVVAGPEGFMKSAYRKFNIKSARPAGVAASGAPGDGITPGDDFGMMREVLTRRFKRAMEEDPERESGTWPDLVLIDGGAGQLSAVKGVLAELGIDDVPLVAIAKGPDRNAGRETFHLLDGTERAFPSGDPVLFFLQRLRDEAHRFAIGAHRARRAGATLRSQLDDIPGIGASRKKALLLRFGSAKEIARAGLEDLESTPGINKVVAKKVYDFFHGAA